MSDPVVRFDKADVVFGATPAAALALLDRGEGRDAIQAATGNVVAVHGADLTVNEGEICVLMGLSGSGKSSLLRCINGLNRVARGHVVVRDGDGTVDIAACDRATLRRLRMNRVSMVFQHFALMPWRTIRDNVALGLEIRGMGRAERYRHADGYLRMVRLEDWADMHPHELSGGMQQRVGLARAFATDADILLMDEPFSALDPLIRNHLQDELLNLQTELRKTIVFVSHDLDEALKLGSRIAIMESGRIVQYGTPEEIVIRPANEYVRRFVANMNPLNVLRGDVLMKPLAELERAENSGSSEGTDGEGNAENAVYLDDVGHCRCVLDGEGQPAAVELLGSPARLVPHRSGMDLTGVDPGDLVCGTPDMAMRDAIEVYHTLGRPVPLLDAEGRLVGVIGAPEIFKGLLRQTGA